MNAIFGPNTPRVLQFLMNLRKLTEAEIGQVASTWSQVNPVDRALMWAHLQLATAVKEEYPVMAAASAARRAAGIPRIGRAGSSSGRGGRVATSQIPGGTSTAAITQSEPRWRLQPARGAPLPLRARPGGWSRR